MLSSALSIPSGAPQPAHGDGQYRWLEGRGPGRQGRPAGTHRARPVVGAPLCIGMVGTPVTVGRVAGITGQVIGLLLAASGMTQVLRGALVVGLGMVVLGCLLIRAAARARGTAAIRAQLRGVVVGEIVDPRPPAEAAAEGAVRPPAPGPLLPEVR